MRPDFLALIAAPTIPVKHQPPTIGRKVRTLPLDPEIDRSASTTPPPLLPNLSRFVDPRWLRLIVDMFQTAIEIQMQQGVGFDLAYAAMEPWLLAMLRGSDSNMPEIPTPAARLRPLVTRQRAARDSWLFYAPLDKVTAEVRGQA